MDCLNRQKSLVYTHLLKKLLQSVTPSFSLVTFATAANIQLRCKLFCCKGTLPLMKADVAFCSSAPKGISGTKGLREGWGLGLCAPQ